MSFTGLAAGLQQPVCVLSDPHPPSHELLFIMIRLQHQGVGLLRAMGVHCIGRSKALTSSPSVDRLGGNGVKEYLGLPLM